MTRQTKIECLQPVSRKDRMTSVRIYNRTADPSDKRAIIVAHFERQARDVSYTSAMRYTKIGAAPFTLHNDSNGSLYISMVFGSEHHGHWPMLVKLGITSIRLSGFDVEHGSKTTQERGQRAQIMNVDAGGFHLDYTRLEGLGEWWEGGSQWSDPDPAVLTLPRSEFWWGNDHHNALLWCDGLTLDVLRAEQADGRAAREKWDTDLAAMRERSRVEREAREIEAQSAPEGTVLS